MLYFNHPFQILTKLGKSMFKRLIASFVCLTFSFSNFQQSQAQTSPATGGGFSVNQLPVPGTMVGKSVPFAPLALKGLVVNPQKPLEFQFIVDTGSAFRPQQLKQQANQLVKYFLAGLTIPEGDLWVNLSPYEKDRMIPTALGQTDLGRDLLAQDYILKQLTASLIYPEKDLGKEFWSRVYSKAQAQFGTTNIPVNTFNKVWILPDQAQVFENGNAVYVTKSTLKVMLDEDYLSLSRHSEGAHSATEESIGSQIIREIVIPEITKEVNVGQNFAPLRQIYQALILAKWYKETIQNGLLDAVYTNKNKVAGVNLNDPSVKEQIYNRYLQAYKKGAFNYIKEDPTSDGQVIPRKYFSGGTFLGDYVMSHDGKKSDVRADGAMMVLKVALEKPDAAMNTFNAASVTNEEPLYRMEFRYAQISDQIRRVTTTMKEKAGLREELVRLGKEIVAHPDFKKRMDSAMTAQDIRDSLLSLNILVLQERISVLKDSAAIRSAIIRLPEGFVGSVPQYLSDTIFTEGQGFTLKSVEDEGAIRLDTNTVLASFTISFKPAMKVEEYKTIAHSLQHSEYVGSGANRDEAKIRAWEKLTQRIIETVEILNGRRPVSDDDIEQVKRLLHVTTEEHNDGGKYTFIIKVDAAMLGKIAKIQYWRITHNVDAMATMLGDGNPRVRQVAEKALIKSGATKERMIDAYIEVLSLTASDVRVNAVNRLGDLGGERAIETMLELLRDNDWKVSYAAAKVLFDLGNRSREVLLRLDVREKMKSRLPAGANDSFLAFENEAYLYALEGYDFIVKYEMAGHTIKWETLHIERGDKLPDRAMSQPQQPDAAMLNSYWNQRLKDLENALKDNDFELAERIYMEADRYQNGATIDIRKEISTKYWQRRLAVFRKSVEQGNLELGEELYGQAYSYRVGSTHETSDLISRIYWDGQLEQARALVAKEDFESVEAMYWRASRYQVGATPKIADLIRDVYWKGQLKHARALAETGDFESVHRIFQQAEGYKVGLVTRDLIRELGNLFKNAQDIQPIHTTKQIP